jgi:hypothetical protein
VGEGVSCWQPAKDGTQAAVGVGWGGVEKGFTCAAPCCVCALLGCADVHA